MNSTTAFCMLALGAGLAVSLASLPPAKTSHTPDRAGAPTTTPCARPRPDYASVIRQTAAMVSDRAAQELVGDVGLNLLNVTWEDTGRFKDSAVGPNISDLTLQVQYREPATDRYTLTCMPVIRFPNFSDRSADLSPDDFYLLVGNERGAPLHKVTLREYLRDIRRYLHDPASFAGTRRSLLAKRDSHVLVSAQACFLPVPRQGKAEFNPVLFNYQSRVGDPAVLSILATREGTSATIIDNARDGFAAGRTWGQRLFFNQAGKRASFTGERLSDFKSSQGSTSSVQAAGEEGLNMVLLIQVPLKQKNPAPRNMAVPCCAPAPGGGGAAESCSRGTSDVENAVIGHGKVEGPFTEIDHQAIERDDRFPVRVTVQFYKATSNGVMSPADAQSIARQIDRVYAKADYVGSLVVGGETGRPTEHSGPKHQPASWWRDFWRKHEQETGQTREEAARMLNRLLGPSWESLPPDEIQRTLKRGGK